MSDLNFLAFLLEEIRDTSSRSDKEDLLNDILNDELGPHFVKLLSFVIDPYRKLNIRVTASMLTEASDYVEESDHEAVWSEFFSLLAQLETSQLSGNRARNKVVEFLRKLHPMTAEWFAQFLNKKLKIGVGRATIEKLIPGIAKRFSVQLCGKYDGSELSHDYYVQPKMDGARGVCAKFTNSKFIALSRNGKPFYNVSTVLSDLEQLESMYDEPMVFDGEFYCGSWNATLSLIRSEKPKSEESLRYYVFDAIPLSYWQSAKVYPYSLTDRDAMLSVAVDSLPLPSIVKVPSILARSFKSISDTTILYVSQGWEGSVLKDPFSLYTYDRSSSWLKYKFFKEVDATIVDVELGYLDEQTGSIMNDKDPRSLDAQSDRWVPVVRSLVVDPGSGILTNVGSGLDQLDRYRFLSMYESGALLGQLVEVRYQDVTPDGKLLFPRFVRLREE